MGVGQAQDLEQALDRAVLAEAAVQRVEDDIGLRREVLEHGRDVRPDVDRRDPIALPLERLAAGLAGAERDLTLGRPPAHQHRDVFWCGHEAPWSLGARSSDAGEQVALQDPRSSAPAASGGRFERVNLTHTAAPSRSRAASSPSLMSRAAAVSSGIRKARSSSHLSSLKPVVNGIGATPEEPMHSLRLECAQAVPLRHRRIRQGWWEPGQAARPPPDLRYGTGWPLECAPRRIPP